MLSAPPPGRNKQLVLHLADGTEKIGWKTFDSVNGHRYWAWDEGARRPSKYDSTLLRAGVMEVKGVVRTAPYEPVRVSLPPDLIARREAEVILKRSLLTDGFRDRASMARQGKVDSTWDSDWHDSREEWNEAYGRHDIFAKWSPETFDWDNYLIGMRWYVRLGKQSRYGNGRQWQKAVRWRALDYSFETIGKRWLDVSRERARTIYHEAVDRVWALALEHAADKAGGGLGPIRRLSLALWDHAAGDAPSDGAQRLRRYLPDLGGGRA